MLLRASGSDAGEEVDAGSVMVGSDPNQSGIEHAAELTDFAEKAVRRDPGLDEARQRLREVAGPVATIEAAAVVGNFQRMVRIADSTGIPIDSRVASITADLRDSIGLNDFVSARVADS